MLGHDLPYYSIDENDIVEPALAFLAGDWDPRWYKYGPLFSYLLSAIYAVDYWILSSFFNWTWSDYYFSVFFEPSPFYFLARSFHLAIIVAITVVAAFFSRRFYGKSELYIVLVLGVAPLFETITNFTVRVDTLQGLLALLCLYQATKFNCKERYYVSYILAGLFFGLCFATKPLPALLLLPAVLIGHIQGCSGETLSTRGQRIRTVLLLNKGLYVFVIFSILIHCLVHPYSVIRFVDFWTEQYETLFSQSSQGGSIAGYDLRWLFSQWGWPLALTALFAPVLLLLKKDKMSYVLITYVVTFVIAFFAFKTRVYWYNSMLPVLMLLVARSIVLGSELVAQSTKLKRARPVQSQYIIAVILILVPVNDAWSLVSSLSQQKRADIAAHEWIGKNLSPDSTILMIGWYAGNLPRLNSADAKSHAQWAEYFMYQRNENAAWVSRYLEAYDRFVATRSPRYKIINIRKDYHQNYGEEIIAGITVNELFNKRLPDLARRSDSRIIVTASYENFIGEWESSESVRLLAQFGPNSGYRGAEVKIFAITSSS
jgi:hypothetical protein